MKKVLLTLAAICMMAAAHGQFYNVSSANNSGRLCINLGMGTPISGLNFYSKSSYYNASEVEASESSYKPGFALSVSMSTLRDKTEMFKLGYMVDFGFYMHQWDATFQGTTKYYFEAKVSSFNMALGASGELLFAEKIGLTFDLGPYFDILTSQKNRSTRTIGLNTQEVDWHDMEKSDMAMPNIDFGMLGRLGANYHFKENMWVGLSFQYKMALFSFGGDSFNDDQQRNLDYSYSVIFKKRSGWAAFLTWGVDL